MTDEVQFIDISDDVTGLPHDEAKRSLAMYVNEVGHGLHRKQNVFICDKDSRSIEYSFVLPDDMSLKVGDRLELLTNYFDSYERNRERKGYGLKNLFKAKPCDEDYASFLSHCLEERLIVYDLTSTLSIPTADIMENLKEAILDPLEGLLEQFIATGNCDLLSSAQLVALRRIFWLKRVYEKSLENWIKISKNSDPSSIDARVPAIAQCQKIISGIKCHDFILEKALSDNRRLGGGGFGSISNLMKNEAVEEACFSLGGRLIQPFDNSVWCEIASNLTRQLSHLMAEHLWPVEQSSDEDEVAASQTRLLEEFIKAGELAALQIRGIERGGDVSGILFASGLRERMVLCGEAFENSHCIKAHLVEQTVTPKGYVAALFERLPPHADSVSDIIVDHNDRFVMTTFASVPVNFDPDIRDLVSIPRSRALLSSCQDEINTTWYIVYQVLFLVEAFAVAFCGTDGIVETLCDRFAVPIKAARFALENGLKSKTADFKKFCRPQTEIRFKKVLDLPHSVKLNCRRGSDKGDNLGRSRIAMPKSSRARFMGKFYRPSSSESNSIKVKSSSDSKRPPARVIWEGRPDEDLDGGWPEGWTKKIFERQSGATKGGTDRYWYSPSPEKYKFRSMAEIRTYLIKYLPKHLDHNLAYAAFKRRSG